jgi:hypothetical protein
MITQGSRTLHDYVQDVRNLVANITENPVDMETQVVTILNGLRKGPVRMQCYRKYPVTLEEAIQLALQEEYSMKQYEQGRAVPPSVRPKKSSDGPEPMDISSVQTYARKQVPNMKERVCFYCGKPGHMRAECRKRLADQASRSRSSKGSDDRAKTGKSP